MRRTVGALPSVLMPGLLTVFQVYAGLHNLMISCNSILSFGRYRHLEHGALAVGEGPSCKCDIVVVERWVQAAWAEEEETRL